MAFKWFGDLLRIFGTDRTKYVDITHNGTRIDVAGGCAFDTNVLVVDAVNNMVGVGTTSPAYKLDIVPLSGGANFRVKSASGVSAIEIGDDWSNNGDILMRDSSGTYKARIRAGGSSYFNGGNVGIGDASPAEKLTVNGNISLKAGTYIVLPGGCRDWGKRAAAPTSPTPVEGDRFWNSTTHAISYFNGSTWS